MSQQIQITGGAKVRDLQDVIIGTSGVLSSVAFDVANGVPRLDVNGKILVSQLPNSVMEYKGTWNAATNTPTLVNGTGNQGDVYLCNVAGTVNFGAGAIAFVVGDQVIYSGSIWQRASGATGTVTSVAITESGDSLNITGSPITTSGTINIGFNGTNLQYVNGAGNLTTFPTLTGYVPYTGATQDVDLGAFKLNAQSLHIKGTAGNGHLGLKHQSASATASANEVSLFADSLGDLSWLNGNLYLSKFITSGNTAARSYTFPNANGTVALTSDLGNYVTLATTQTITGAKTFSGYTTFTSTVDITSGLTFSNSGFTLVLQPPTLSVNRTVTLPNGTGTLALTSDLTSYVTLTTAQTISGVKTFSTYPLLDAGILIKHTGILTASGYTGITATTTGLVLSLGAGGGGSLIFQSTSYSYTFPAATGTLALTTDLGAYLPLAGGTLTGALGGTSASFSGAMNADSYGMAGAAQAMTWTTNTLRLGQGSYWNNIELWDGSTIRLKMLSGGNVLIGTTTDSGYKLDVNGTGRFTNTSDHNLVLNSTGRFTSLDFSNNGTLKAQIFWDNTTAESYFYSGSGYMKMSNTGAATFSSSLQTNSYQIINGVAGGTSTYLQFNNNGTAIGYVGSSAAINSGASTSVTLGVASGAGLTIASTGAATFSSDITGKGSFNGYVGATQNLFIDWSASSQIVTLTNTELFFGTNAQRRMTITSGGNVLIGTTTDSGYKLDVNGTGRFSGAANTMLTLDSTNTNGYTATQINYSGSAKALIGYGTYLTTDGGVAIRTAASTPFTIAIGGATPNFTIASTGAATFSSSVTAGGAFISSMGNSTQIFLSNSATTGYQYATISNTGANLNFGIERSTGGALSNGSLAYASLIQTSNSTALQFGTNNNIRATIDASGNVGINTSTPMTFGGFTNLTIRSSSASNQAAIFLLNSTETIRGSWYSNGATQVNFGTASSHPLVFDTNDAERMRITSGGNVLIGTTTDATGKLQVNGTIYATGFYESSDIRFKNILETNPNINLSGIDVIKFTRKDNDANQVRYGYSAQQVQSILPDAVTGTDFLNVNYLDIHTLKIAQLEQEIKELKAKMN